MRFKARPHASPSPAIFALVSFLAVQHKPWTIKIDFGVPLDTAGMLQNIRLFVKCPYITFLSWLTYIEASKCYLIISSNSILNKHLSIVSLKLHFNVPKNATVAKGRISSVKRLRNGRDHRTSFARTNMFTTMVDDPPSTHLLQRNDFDFSG